MKILLSRLGPLLCWSGFEGNDSKHEFNVHDVCASAEIVGDSKKTSMKFVYVIINILIAAAILVSSVGLLFVYSSNYIAEVHMAKSIPLAIIFGFSLLSASLYYKR